MSLPISNKRITIPREWSPQDQYFYIQIIHEACNINYIPSTIASTIAETVRNTSPLRSEWKKIAAAIGINNEEQLMAIEDAAKYKEEQPLYVALTTQYRKNPAASLGALLNSLMNLKRYDILIRIKDDVRGIVHEFNRSKISTSSSSQEDLKNQPVEEESIASSTAYQKRVQDKNIKDSKSKIKSYYSSNCCCTDDSCLHSDKSTDNDSAFYDNHSQDSLLYILNRYKSVKNNDSLVDCCHLSCEKERCSMPVWKEKYQNKENLAENKKILPINKKHLSETKHFMDPTDKNQSLNTNINEIELNLGNSDNSNNEVTECGKIKTSLSPTTDNSDIAIAIESVSSNASTDECYDSDSTCDHDFDIVSKEEREILQEAFGTISLSSPDTDCDDRRIENEKVQHLTITEYRNLENRAFEDQYNGIESETYDINNSVNESIENLVAERDESVRSLQRAERQPISSLFPLKIHESTKKPQDYFLSLMSNVLPGTISVDRSLKVIVIHSEEDKDIAIALAAALFREFHMAAVAEYQLNALWTMDPCHYRVAALDCADVIIPLITNAWLDDITNEKPLSERETSSLNARFVYRILQNKFLNGGSVNLSSIPVVMEGTRRDFLRYPEIRDASRLSKNFCTNGEITILGNLIKDFHEITRDKRKQF